ncbi:MAG TPA: hypothetical protein VFF80_08695 [Bacillota bacterium]|nr:hypothetical protein [Bacillota bacterium]
MQLILHSFNLFVAFPASDLSSIWPKSNGDHCHFTTLQEQNLAAKSKSVCRSRRKIQKQSTTAAKMLGMG